MATCAGKQPIAAAQATRLEDVFTWHRPALARDHPHEDRDDEDESADEPVQPRESGRRRCGVHERNVKLSRAASRSRVAGPRPSSVPLGPADHLLPSHRRSCGSPSDRTRISGVQRRPTVRGLHDFRGQDAASEERHDDRAHDRRRDDAGRARRMRDRDDGARPGRLRHQHGREPLSRPALRAELHASSRLTVPRRPRPLRGRRHPHLRRAVPGDACCSRPTLHPRFPRPVRHERSGVDVRVPLSARSGPPGASVPAARSTPSSRERPSLACRSTRRRPATAPSG